MVTVMQVGLVGAGGGVVYWLSPPEAMWMSWPG